MRRVHGFGVCSVDEIDPILAGEIWGVGPKIAEIRTQFWRSAGFISAVGRRSVGRQPDGGGGGREHFHDFCVFMCLCFSLLFFVCQFFC